MGNWYLAAAQAAPYLMNMFMPQPGMPTMQGVPMNTQAMNQMSTYDPQLLQTAFTTDNPAYKAASENATNQVQTALAKMGLNRSSLGAGAVGGAQAKIAALWAQNAANNQARAMSDIASQQQIQNQLNEFNASVANQGAMNSYLQGQMNRNNTIGGVGGIAGILANMFGGGPGSMGSGSSGGTGYSAAGPYSPNNNYLGNYSYASGY